MIETLEHRIRARIVDVPNFPADGVMFKDITPVLADWALLTDVVAAMASAFAHDDISHVLAAESRGFLFGVPIALALRAAFVPARKPGKLPRATVQAAFELEYGNDTLAIHADALGADALGADALGADALGEKARVLIVDDVLATGGTAAACCRLIATLGGTVVGASMLIELGFLGGRERLHVAGRIESIVQY